MKDTNLYSRILGLTVPWFVESVELTTFSLCCDK